jgi:hypothetical protein
MTILCLDLTNHIFNPIDFHSLNYLFRLNLFFCSLIKKHFFNLQILILVIKFKTKQKIIIINNFHPSLSLLTIKNWKGVSSIDPGFYIPNKSMFGH